MKHSIKNITLFCTENAPNGTNDLLIVNERHEVIDCLENALFGATSKLGANNGVYAETAGGYAGQIHSAFYLNYEGDKIMSVSNLQPYELDEEELQDCPERDEWSMIDFMDNCYDGDKLYIVEYYALERLSASSPICENGFERVFNFLSKHIDQDEIIEELEPSEMQKVHMLSHALWEAKKNNKGA